jgi:hypothetical protein
MKGSPTRKPPMCRSVCHLDRSVHHRPDLLVTMRHLQELMSMGVWTIAIPSTLARARTENCCSAEICLGWPTVDGLHLDDAVRSIDVKLLLSSWCELVVIYKGEHHDPQTIGPFCSRFGKVRLAQGEGELQHTLHTIIPPFGALGLAPASHSSSPLEAYKLQALLGLMINSLKAPLQSTYTPSQQRHIRLHNQ